jgi:hypothetical protein
MEKKLKPTECEKYLVRFSSVRPMDTEMAYDKGLCKDCEHNADCRFLTFAAYSDDTYNCKGELLSSYSIGD